MMMAPAFRNLDANLEEAARMSGAGALSTLFRIVVPASTPMVCVASLMSLIRSFESFEVELVLGTPFRFSVYSTKIYSLDSSDAGELRWRNGSEHVDSNCDSAVGHFTTLGQSPPALHHAHRTVQANSVRPGQVALAYRHGGFFGRRLRHHPPVDLFADGKRNESLWPLRNRTGLVAAPLGCGFGRSRILKSAEKYFDPGLCNDDRCRCRV